MRLRVPLAQREGREVIGRSYCFHACWIIESCACERRHATAGEKMLWRIVIARHHPLPITAVSAVVVLVCCGIVWETRRRRVGIAIANATRDVDAANREPSPGESRFGGGGRYLSARAPYPRKRRPTSLGRVGSVTVRPRRMQQHLSAALPCMRNPIPISPSSTSWRQTTPFFPPASSPATRDSLGRGKESGLHLIGAANHPPRRSRPPVPAP